MENQNSVRVRFAPSPTGYLHIGGARTALFNYLFARHYKGKFFLRIEDTDVSRSSAEMTDVILNSLRWLGLEWDETPVHQSHRIDKYRNICKELVQKGSAYQCFCSYEELRRRRAVSQNEKDEYRYDRKCLNLSREDSAKKLGQGIPYTIRFKIPDGETSFDDAIRGPVTIKNQEIDDFIILRSDNSPVYQIAVVVDDHDMGITHVIRGDDHLSNTPKQIMIYKAMCWPIPEFAHVPMIMGPDRKRLSKRQGAASVEEFKVAGFLPQVVVNFLALLGWSPGDDREILSMKDMVDSFTLKGISKNPAVFDETKLTWMNDQYLTRMEDDQLLNFVTVLLKKEELVNNGFMKENKEYLLRYIHLLKGRTKKLTDFVEWGSYFFKDPDSYDQKAVEKYWLSEGAVGRIEEILEQLECLESWKENNLEQIVRSTAERMGTGAGKLIHPIRLAITGFGVSPGLFELMEVLGKERVIRRLKNALEYLFKIGKRLIF